MSNTCLKENPTILEIMAERDKLKQENEQLKLDRDYWKSACKLLHNEIENRDAINSIDNNEGGYNENEFNILAKAYADFGY